MQSAKKSLKKILLFTFTCLTITLSPVSPGSFVEETDNTTERVRNETLNFWYWMEGISLAQFMLSEEYYGDKVLDLDDLKRIYSLSLTASHVLDPLLYQLRNAYYSAASQQGEPFNSEKLTPGFKALHAEYIKWLGGLHKTMSPYHTYKDIGKTFRTVFKDTYEDTYPDAYYQYKQLLLHYRADEKPHIPSLGQQRAEQWLKFEMLNDLKKNLESPVRAFLNVKAFLRLIDYHDCVNEYGNRSSTPGEQACVTGYILAPLQKYLALVSQGSLFKKLMPEIHEKMLEIANASPEFLYSNSQRVTQFYFIVLDRVDEYRLPYGISSIPMNFSLVKKLRGTTLNLHAISRLSLSELEQLRDDIAVYRKVLSSMPITPVILLRQLGLRVD